MSAPRPETAQAARRAARVWAILDALAYAGALFDPTGALLVARYRGELRSRR